MFYFSYLNQAFYHSDVHEMMPNDVIEITDELYQTLFMAVNGGAKIMRDLTIVSQPSAAHVWQPEKQKWVLDKSAQKAQFQAAQSNKMTDLNRVAQSIVNQAAGTDKLPEFEVQSWTLQAAEAKAWAQNPEIATPILDQIAAARGVPADVLKRAALRKTQQYEALTALVAGQRQALQTRIEAAKTLDELNAIEIAFKLPEMGGNP